MLNTVESIALMILIVTGSLGCLTLLRRVWPSQERRQHNDLIGWLLSVIGTTYAVIIAFMLYAVWTNFEAANGNAEAEADSLINVARLAQGLPAAQRLEIQSLTRQYVDVMLTEEWPAMRDLRFSPASARITEELWTAATHSDARTVSEQADLEQTLTELSNMTGHRRLRSLQASTGIPAILWAVLIVGAIITIVSACLFGSTNFKFHLAQVVMLSLMLSLILVAIADISRPFQGAIYVAPVGFERARTTLDNMGVAKQGKP